MALGIVYRSGRTLFFVILAATAVTSATTAAQLLVGRSILDLLASANRVDFSELAPYLAALGGLLMVGSLSQAVSAELRVPLSERVQRHVMDHILDVSTAVDLEAYESSDFHDRLQRAGAAAGGKTTAIVFGLVTIMSTIVVATGLVIVLVAVVPILVPIAIIGYLPVALVNVRNNRATYDLEWGLTQLMRERSYLEHLLTNRDSAKEVRSYGLAAPLRRWHGNHWETRLRLITDLVQRRLLLTAAGTAVSTSVVIGALSVALVLAGRGSISLGDAAVAVVGFQQLNGRLQAASGALSNVHAGVTFLGDFEGFRATLPAIRRARPTAAPPMPPTVLTVDGLGYRYPGGTSDALRSVGFELRAGQSMAIVGANGSGKSTLAKILCGLLPPSRGTVRWDGTDLAACDPELVRSQISPVFQDYQTLYFTIRENIALADTSAALSDNDIRTALARVDLDTLVDSLPRGLDARLGKAFSDGVDLSVGQWQRLAIARALARDAATLVFDEPAASLDPRAEAQLFDLLQSAYHDRIVVYISHRFATARMADVIAVLDNGELIELGDHDELMARQGLYAEMFGLQAARYGLS